MQELEKILEEIDDLIVHSGWPSLNIIEKDKVDGIIRKHMNDGWIPTEKFGLPRDNEHDFRFWITIQYDNGFRSTIKAKWDCFDKCFIYQNGRKILQNVIAYKYYSEPKPYRPERSDNNDGE